MDGMAQGLVTIVGLYLLGLVFLVTVIAKGKAGRVWGLVLGVYFFGPWAYGYAYYLYSSVAQERAEKAKERGNAVNSAAMDKFCQNPMRNIHRKADSEPVASLLVSTGEFSVPSFFDRMASDRSLCTRTGIRFLEQKADGIEKITVYSICNRANYVEVSAAQARYELVFKPRSKPVPAPWQGMGSMMSSSRVQIVDRFTGDVLAEDTFYDISNSGAGNACPRNSELVNALVLDVFGH